MQKVEVAFFFKINKAKKWDKPKLVHETFKIQKKYLNKTFKIKNIIKNDGR